MEGQAVASNDRENRPLTPLDKGAASIREQVLRAELLKLQLAYKDDVDSLGAKAGALDAQIVSLNAQIASQEERERQAVALLEAQIASQGERERQVVASLNAQIASQGERERQIIASLDAQVAALRERERHIVASRSEYESQLDHLNRIVAERDATIRALYASWSWKFSFPVRVASRLAKRIVRGLIRREPPPVQVSPSADTGAERTLHADRASQPAAPEDQATPPASAATPAPEPQEAPASPISGPERTVDADHPSQPAEPAEPPVPAASPTAAAPAQDNADLWSRFSSGPAPTAASRKVFIAVEQWPASRRPSAEARLSLFLDFFAQSKRPVILTSVQPFEHAAPAPTAPATMNGTSCSACGLREVEDLLAAGGGEIQYALLIGADTADALLPLVRLHCPWVRVIVDLGDSLPHNNRLELTGEAKAEVEQRESIEARVARDADLIFVLNDLTKAALLTHAPDAVIEVLPNPINISLADLPGVATRSQVICVAEMAEAAALDWLVDIVWPAVRSEMPDATLKIIGTERWNGAAASVAAPGVELVASAPDLRAILFHTRVLVAPEPTPDGVNLAGVPGFSCGLPLVATPAIADRLGRQDDVDVLVAGEPALFAQHIVRLLRDDSLWTRIHTNALNLAEARFAPEAIRKTIDGLFNA